jgi:hypothetical protein
MLASRHPEEFHAQGRKVPSTRFRAGSRLGLPAIVNQPFGDLLHQQQDAHTRPKGIFSENSTGQSGQRIIHDTPEFTTSLLHTSTEVSVI